MDQTNQHTSESSQTIVAPHRSNGAAALFGGVTAIGGGHAPLMEGEFNREDLRFPVLVLYQGTTKEKQRPWYSDGLQAGAILDPNTGETFNGEYDKDTKTGKNRFTILSIRKAYVMHAPRNGAGNDPAAAAPIINETSSEEVRRKLTPEFLAEHGWEPGDTYDPKTGVYVESQLDNPFDWSANPNGGSDLPPLLQTNFEFLVLFEDGFVGVLRFQSRRDGDKAGASLFTAFIQNQSSPRPWCFVVNSAIRSSGTTGETWLGLQAKRAGLASEEHAALHARWTATLATTTIKAVDGDAPDFLSGG